MEPIQKAVASSWLEIDQLGYRRTLERKGKAWMVFELVQNAWDTKATRVDVTLTKPKNGMSTLKCVDNDPDGYRCLDEAHTMFGSSSKKADPTLRGRFNAGEKQVVVMCDKASVTSTTGQVLFLANGKRKESSEVTTEVGTVFEGRFELNDEEFAEVSEKVLLLFPPITTTFNGVEIRQRNPLRTAEETLWTEQANERGVLTPRKRKTDVNIYGPQPGETVHLYERGIPVVEIEGMFHVSVEQKVPLNMDRDNVTPHYLKNIYTVVLNAMHDFVKGEEASQPWVISAVSNTDRVSAEATKAYVREAFGEKTALKDYNDPGSIKETESRGFNNVPPSALPPGVRKTLTKHLAMEKTSDICPTDVTTKIPEHILTRAEYDDDQRQYATLVETISPLLIGHDVRLQFFRDEDVELRGCFLTDVAANTVKGRRNFKPGSFLFEVNLAYHDSSDWADNYRLLIHELAHHHPNCQNNDHLQSAFYETVNRIGAKLAQLALKQPELFPEAAFEAVMA
jgi:hypothetical protein